MGGLILLSININSSCVTSARSFNHRRIEMAKTKELTPIDDVLRALGVSKINDGSHWQTSFYLNDWQLGLTVKNRRYVVNVHPEQSRGSADIGKAKSCGKTLLIR